MPRFFNIAGPCNAEWHYMLPTERRIPRVRQHIAQAQYFVIHAPRQTGKTTCFQALATELTHEGRYAALYASCEPAQAAGGNLELGVASLLGSLDRAAEKQLPPELQPEAPEGFSAVVPTNRLLNYLGAWSRRSPLPAVLFLDEIDALIDDTLLSVLRQLRSGYSDRPRDFPQSVALIGLRDVRDYKTRVRPHATSLGTSSPFNIKVESITLRNFTREEVAELYGQHTQETGQLFTEEATARAYELTRGQPWLVNALARQAVENDVPEGATVTAAHIEAAKESLIERRDTHLDSLIDKLREPRVRRVLEPILAGELLLGDRLDDDVAYVEDLGLIAREPSRHAKIANPIYQEVIPRALAYGTQRTIVQETSWYVRPDGMLDMPALLRAFLDFWKEHGDALLGAQPYHEVAPHLVLMAFLQRIVNGGGTIDREYAVGSGRMDLCIRWPHALGLQREALELKVWRDAQADPLAKGLEQLGGYLSRLGLDRGTLCLFDRRSEALPIAERSSLQEREHEGRLMVILRL